MQSATAHQPMPPFINDEFVLGVSLSLGGRATLTDMKGYVKTHYSGWTDNAIMYFGSQVSSLLKSGYLEKTKIDFRHGETKPVFFISDEAKVIIECSG